MTDPRRNTTEFTWNTLGLLESDRDAEGGEQTLTRTETANGHDIELTTIGGRTRRYETRNLPTADTTRRVISAAGVETNTAFGRDGTTTNSFSDGSTMMSRTSADPA